MLGLKIRNQAQIVCQNCLMVIIMVGYLNTGWVSRYKINVNKIQDLIPTVDYIYCSNFLANLISLAFVSMIIIKYSSQHKVWFILVFWFMVFNYSCTDYFTLCSLTPILILYGSYIVNNLNYHYSVLMLRITTHVSCPQSFMLSFAID